jgi:hypothetical protein
VTTDDSGKIDGDLKVTVTDPKGKVLVKNSSSTSGVIPLGGGTMPGTAFVTLPAQSPVGKYSLEVVFTDKRSSQSANFRRQFSVLPSKLAIVGFRFFYDAEGKIPASGAGLRSENLHFRFRVVGFDRSHGKINTQMTMNVQDQSGKDTMPKPVQAAIANDDPATVKKSTNLNFSANVALNAVGDFTLVIVVEDRLAKQKVQFTTPLHVTAP